MSDILDLIDNTIEHVEGWPDAMRWQPAPRGWAKSGADELYWAMWRRKCRSVMQTQADVVFHDSHVILVDECAEWLRNCGAARTLVRLHSDAGVPIVEYFAVDAPSHRAP